MTNILLELMGDQKRIGVHELFERWYKREFGPMWLRSPYWYLERDRVFDKWMREILRTLRSYGTHAIDDDCFVPIQLCSEAIKARSHGQLTAHEELWLERTTL